MERFKILIADDEKPARKKIISMLKEEFSDLEILESENGIETVSKIENENPQLIFLDIQMPGLTGFGVIEKIGVEKFPPVVFVTAYDQYAIDAFEVQAIDYLLKPFDKDRLLKAYNRAVERIKNKKNENEQIRELLNSISTAKKYKTRLTVKENHSHFFVNTDEIIFLEVNEKYLDVHTVKKSYLLRDTISSIEKELNPTVFRRVNRSTIVNMNFIKEIQPWSHGDYLIILHNSSKIKLSRKFTQNILEDK